MMTSLTTGDLAQSFHLRRHNQTLKTQLDTLVQEIATGQTADQGARLSGDFMPLSAIERSLTALDAYKTTTAEAALMTQAMQVSLDNLAGAADQVTPALLLAGGAPEATLLATTGADALGKLEQAVAALNGAVTGRALFSGAATDTRALAPADVMMAELKTLIAVETTPGGVMAAVAAWFDTPGGGFETAIYGGADTAAGPMRLAEGQTLSLDVTAADPALRDVLRGLATAALLADEATLGGDVDARAGLALMAGEHLLTAEGALSTLQAEVGTAQNRIETIQVENAAQTTMLTLARTELIGADPYETATELEAVQTQLETLYTITARLARLSLADYLS
ncbi:flagellin [Actibacterium sp. D379-3]